MQPGAPTDSNLGLPTQDFDRLFEVLRGALTKDTGAGFVFSCLSGQGRTTTAMVVAVLAFWHICVCETSREGSMGSGCLGTLAVPAGCRGRADPGQRAMGRADPWQGARGLREKCSLGRSAPLPAAVLPQGFPEVAEEELVSVPDAKFTKGEFEVSTPCTVPGGHLGEGEGTSCWQAGKNFQSSSRCFLFHFITSVLLCSHFTDEQTRVWGSPAPGPWQTIMGDKGPGPPSSCLTLLLGDCMP